ncbi:hypothetical protein CB1_000268004 [Camelus ferus]|nr:hypothetical protein CB1_000268004 [Camelus ferus]
MGTRSKWLPKPSFATTAVVNEGQKTGHFLIPKGNGPFVKFSSPQNLKRKTTTVPFGSSCRANMLCLSQYGSGPRSTQLLSWHADFCYEQVLTGTCGVPQCFSLENEAGQ